MDKHKVLKSIILNLENVDFTSKDTSLRQLASAVDLIEVLAIEMRSGEPQEVTGLCKHPKDDVVDISTLSEPNKGQCFKCNTIIDL
jgi:hypothetical protein